MKFLRYVLILLLLAGFVALAVGLYACADYPPQDPPAPGDRPEVTVPPGESTTAPPPEDTVITPPPEELTTPPVQDGGGQTDVPVYKLPDTGGIDLERVSS